jgi:hypothetical protein
MAREQASFRLDPRHLKILRYMTDVLSKRDDTTYSQAQILERAIGCLFSKEFNYHGSEIYEAFAIEEDE